MCPLCIATGTIAFASAGSAGGLGAIAAKVLRIRRERAAQGRPFPASKKANAGPVARPGIVPAKAA